MKLPRITQAAHHYMTQFIQPGDTVVDATCGNGNDTLFLARCVGPNGKVFAFDIQKQALENAKMKLSDEEGLAQVHFIHDSHDRMDHYVTEKVQGIMFNLGYLPGGDKSITTQGNTTIGAIKVGMELLREGGLMTICLYPGHEEGRVESELVLEWVKGVEQEKYQVLQYAYINLSNNPPFLIAIYKNERSK